MGSKKPEHFRVLDRIQKELDPFLKKKGFRKKGRSYNRRLDGPLVQVLDFQTWPYRTGDKNPVVRLLLGSKYGQFTVNLGICLPAIKFFEQPHFEDDWIEEYDCQMRVRLGELTAAKADRWWNLRKGEEKVLRDLRPLIEGEAMGFLDAFASVDSLLAHWKAKGVLPGSLSNPHRSAVDVALVLFERGSRSEALTLLRKTCEEARGRHRYFAAYIEGLIAKLEEKP